MRSFSLAGRPLFPDISFAVLKINELGILPTKLFILPKLWCISFSYRSREATDQMVGDAAYPRVKWQICRIRFNDVERDPVRGNGFRFIRISLVRFRNNG